MLFCNTLINRSIACCPCFSLQGPCNEPRPWGWNVVSNAKWQSWKQLGDLSSLEAMRLYVRTLEEDEADWWSADVADGMQQQALEEQSNAADVPSTPTPSPPSAPPQHLRKSNSSVNAVPAIKSRSVAEVVIEGSWVSPYIASDRRPPPRYEQAMALVGTEVFIIGGNCGGRYLSDTWALNLENLTWRCVVAGKLFSTGTAKSSSSLATQQITTEIDDAAAETETTPLVVASSQGMPPVAGHAAVAWNGNVVSIGGHTKEKTAVELPVHVLDVASKTWTRASTWVAEGVPFAPPRPRGGHSATPVGSKVYVFGGEDAKRKPLDELWTLDASTMEWDKPETSGLSMSARSAHSACSFQNRYILFFGGGSVVTCFNDLSVLDTQTMSWSRPETQGQVPPPRAGHAASILGSTLYIVGGGNNARGCADMYSLDLTNLGGGSVDDHHPLYWTLIGNTPAESAIAAEGLALLCVPMAGCLLSFGGYNGKYHNAVHVYRPDGYTVVKSSAALKSAAAALPRPPSLPHLPLPSTTTTTTSASASAPASAPSPPQPSGLRSILRGGGGGGATTTTTTTGSVAASPHPGGSQTHLSQQYTTRENSSSSLSAAAATAATTAATTAAAADLETVRREAAAAKEAVALEISIMRRQLDSATAALAEAERVAEEARDALTTEQQKSMGLEVEVAELRQQMVTMREMERELARYRQRAEEEAAKKPGLWGFITGADQAASIGTGGGTGGGAAVAAST